MHKSCVNTLTLIDIIAYGWREEYWILYLLCYNLGGYKPKGIPIAAHTSFGIDGIAYIYYFENHGFDDYNIFYKVVDNH